MSKTIQIVQKWAAVTVWACVGVHGIGNLHVCQSTVYAKLYIQVLEQHKLPLLLYFPCCMSYNVKQYYVQITAAW